MNWAEEKKIRDDQWWMGKRKKTKTKVYALRRIAFGCWSWNQNKTHTFGSVVDTSV